MKNIIKRIFKKKIIHFQKENGIAHLRALILSDRKKVLLHADIVRIFWDSEIIFHFE